MKLNKKYYSLCETEPIETQELENGIVVEIHMLNDNPFFKEVINQNQFSLWSIDGNNTYKLFLEKGYYDIMKGLYSKKINAYWVKYWNDCDQTNRNFFFKLCLPIFVVYYSALFLISGILMGNSNSSEGLLWSGVFAILGFFLIFAIMKRILKKKLRQMNKDVLAKIKKVYGAKEFENTIRKQRKYCGNYFKTKEEITDKKEEE